ncbi:MAG TPA: carboxypeptidase regulatory-like domain-containing protein [Gaiellaceae bacterium]
MTAVAILATLLSGLYGVVTRGPTTPVCQAGVPCSAPYANATLVFSRPSVTRRVTTDAKGKYRIALAPGRWSLRVQNAHFGAKPTAVWVPTGRYAKVNVFVDTGIR